jgi:hypothetical protein
MWRHLLVFWFIIWNGLAQKSHFLYLHSGAQNDHHLFNLEMSSLSQADFEYCRQMHGFPKIPWRGMWMTCWGWLWSNWWNEDWQGKPKYSEKTRPSAILSTTNPTWPDPGSNLGCRGEATCISLWFCWNLLNWHFIYVYAICQVLFLTL